MENKPQVIELVAVRSPAEGDELIAATVFVPKRSANFFADRSEASRYEDEAVVARIKDVCLAAVRSLFTDEMELLPQAEHKACPHPTHETTASQVGGGRLR